MHTHKVESFLVTDNVRLEIVHESNPYFAGEHISLVIRLRHLGSLREQAHWRSRIDQLHRDIEERLDREHAGESAEQEQSKLEGPSAWSMKFLFGAFRADEGPQQTEAADGESTDLPADVTTEDEEGFRQFIMKQLRQHKPVDLISAYVQVAGMFQYNLDVIAEDQLQNKGAKIVGFDVLEGAGAWNKVTQQHELSQYSNSSYEFTANLDSRYVLTPGANTGNDNSNAQYSEDYKELPTFLIPQTLLFSEISLQPGEVKTFHFKSTKLPVDLCPSYTHSRNVAVNYSLQFGVSTLSHDEIVPYKTRIPITIAPFVDSNSGQYTAMVDKVPTIMQPGTIKEVNVKQKRSPSSASMFTRRSSGNLLNDKLSNDTIKLMKQKFIELVEDNKVGAMDIDQLVDKQLEVQFGNAEDSETNEDPFETGDAGIKPSSTTRDNIMGLKRSIPKNLSKKLMKQDQENGNPKTLISQLDSSLQRSYVINRNGTLIAKIGFSKLFYTTNDDIDLVIYPEPHTGFKISAVNVSLESAELLNKTYVLQSEQVRPFYHNVSDARSVCYDECQSIPLKLLIPRTPRNQISSQFRTNIFELKWVLSFQFILIDRRESDDGQNLFQFYEDKKGALYHSKKTMEGEEFSFKMPICILPSSKNFGGW
ncbi:Rgp1p KNAG_0I00980 [Huiozyma naganishii CBS 8797]|uniref:Uncharacterized protein n=1 Tax=Huiozyma naganishii (strain ATCC MYA-139 / BCRC 22969 / CBS 8797 / KCTC 17520 / NBRC 10181 / NCYC 3082 / Yp74L-3) TaxID=1071383 RepID=J7S933_HUIN7|nr:hypothetical protein KNAG_0I00980 [Kazachstania naganishii CBS 8797]CCK71889.1 hypothetical protein KNAG_0I00980 [Kazachstania naganishii CBS 8797]